MIALAAWTASWLAKAIEGLLLPADRGGDASKGLAIWVEPLAWPAVRWGKRPAARALRLAGFEGEYRFWSWHRRWQGLLLLPALANRRLTERSARQIADAVADQRRRFPDAPIYLLGYSAGGYVACRALELLPDDVQVDSAALLAAAFDPRRDLRPALAHVRDRLVVASSWNDWFVCGLGTLAFGTADRVHTFSIAMLGPRGPGRDDPRLTHIRWRPATVARGILGTHEWCLPVRVLRRYVLPEMGLRE